jgi:hypothetical protein
MSVDTLPDFRHPHVSGYSPATGRELHEVGTTRRARSPHTARTSTAPARAGAARRVSVSVPPPACPDGLAPRRLRVPRTSPPHRARGRGREHYGSATRVNRQEGDQSGSALGENPEPPRPRKTRPGSRFSPRPPFLPPQTNATHRANDRKKCTAQARECRAVPAGRGNCKAPGEPGKPHGNPPKPGFPGSPEPPPALPPPKGALRAPQPTPIPDRPGHHGTQHTNPPTPQHPPAPAGRETGLGHTEGAPPAHKDAPTSPAAGQLTSASPDRRTAATHQA